MAKARQPKQEGKARRVRPAPSPHVKKVSAPLTNPVPITIRAKYRSSINSNAPARS